jgi:hypothetical protein
VFLVNISLAQETAVQKINFDGNIKAVFKRDSGKKINGKVFYPGVHLIIGKTNEYPQVNIDRCLYFFDAKFDEKSKKLAIVYYTGRSLGCKYYELQDDKWVLLKSFYMSYSIWSYCTKVKLVDMNTIEMTLEGQSTNEKKGVKKTYPITITDNYEIEKINGKKIDDSLANPTFLINYINTEDLMDLRYYGNILDDRLKEKAKKMELTNEEKKVINRFE